MKKALKILLLVIIIFLILVYLSVSSTDKEFSTCTIENLQDIEKIDFKKHDSVLISPNSIYKGNELKNLMQGENYRKAWSTPVKMPIAFLDTLKGGLKITDEGGGMQTQSLKLKSSNGIMFTLRSINKDPEALVPESAKNLGLENIIVDGISGQHPYGAILTASLAETVGVMHTHPQVLFIPKQKILGKFNKKYGNRIFLLEYETESDKNWSTYKNVSRIVETNDLQELKSKLGKKLQIDEHALVRARLFDMLIGDWDRHAKQWGWLLQKKNNGFNAIPLPADRDNAFFNLEGVIPQIITNKNVEPLVRPFAKTIDYMPGLVYPFDVYFLHSTPEKVFVEEAQNIQRLLTDKKLDDAFRVWPKDIYDLNGNEIKVKIKSRREHLMEYAKEFHKIISEKDLLSKPLKGSEDVDLSSALQQCFECE